MSKKVLLIAGVLLAAGSAAAISSPYFRGAQLRLGQMLGEFGDGDGDSGVRPGRSGEHHRQMDADEGGGQEFSKARRARFAPRDLEDDALDMSASSREWTGRRRDRAQERQLAEAEPGEDGGRLGKDAARARRDMSERASGRGDRQFARLDRNGDGFIDAKEFEAWVAERAARALQRFLEHFDADGDGKVSKDEFRRFARDRLANRDADADDQITEAELAPAKPGRGIQR